MSGASAFRAFQRHILERKPQRVAGNQVITHPAVIPAEAALHALPVQMAVDAPLYAVFAQQTRELRPLTQRLRQQRQKLCELAWKLLFEDKAAPEDSLPAWADALTAAWNHPQPDARSREIFLAIYENLPEPEFSLQTIAQQRLFMSEDHLRRIFSQMTGNRFSAYLEHCRITQARRLLEFQPDMKISRLAELVGYPLDGQYFSKVFRKICGVTPTEYRNHH